MQTIGRATLPTLIRAVLERAEAGSAVLPRDFDATEAYAAGLCTALGLAVIENDEAQSLSRLALTRPGRASLGRLRKGMPFDRAIDLSKPRELSPSIVRERGNAKKV